MDIKFKQSNWLEPYIELNTEIRKKAKNDFKKDFYKLTNNSVLTKIVENIRKRIAIKLVSDEKYEKLISKSNYTIFSQNLVTVQLNYVQQTKFCYRIMKPKYKDKIMLLYGCR